MQLTRTRTRPDGRRPAPAVRWLTATVAWTLSLALVGTAAPAAAEDSPLDHVGHVDHPVSGIYISTGTTEAFSTPAIADVTGDGRPDMVVGSLDGTLEAFNLPSRTRIWSMSVGRAAIESSPVIVDVTGDGRNDIVIGAMDAKVHIIDGPTGQIVRTFTELEPLHCPPGTDCRPHGFFATPAVADINGDGVLDIIAPSWDHTVYAWSSTGQLLWRRYIEDTLWSSPVVADIDRNGTPEIVLGGDIWAGNPLNAPEGGLVWILNRDGSTYAGYPKFVPLQTVWSTPAVVDLNRDGELDVVVGTGTHFPDPGGRWVDAFTARTGRSLPGWPVAVAGRAMTSPAIGELDGDPELEVAVGSEGGYIYAFDTNGREMWRSCESGHPQGCFERYATHGGVAIADVDDDGAQEVVAGFDHQMRIHDSRTGRIESARAFSSGLALTPASTPVIAEIDGSTHIAQAYYYEDNTRVDLFSTGRRLCRADWPTFMRSSRRTGRFQGVPGASGPFKCPIDFVEQQYADFLGRGLDARGAAYWVNNLDSGWTGARVIRSFMDSPEFRRVVAPTVRVHLAVTGGYPTSAAVVRDGAAFIRGGGNPAVLADRLLATTDLGRAGAIPFVTRVFSNIFGRSPNLVELTVAVHRLQTGTTRGQLVTSWTEGSGAARLAAEVDVAMTYLGMLNRAPDARGWVHWVPAARRGGLESLITGFQTSAEYRQRVTAPGAAAVVAGP